VLAELGLAGDLDKLPISSPAATPARRGGARVIHRPRVITADEPTGSLDADSSGR
jgi:ABC-type ATPase involved in cell division